MAPTPRSLQCKELTWQPTKRTFCEALGSFFAHQLASFELELASFELEIERAIKDEAWDLDWKGKRAQTEY